MMKERALHVAVVGAGFVGVTIADALVRQGCDVTIVVAEGEPMSASEVTYAWLNSHRKRPDAYQELNQRGLRYWRDTFGPAHPEHVHWNGHTVVVEGRPNIDMLAMRIDYLQSLGYPVEVRTVNEARSELPIRVPDRAAVACFPAEGHCDPGPIRSVLIDRLASSGRCRWIRDRATTVDGALITLLSSGQVAADRVVVAAGNGSAELLRTAGFELPMVDQYGGGPAWGFLADVRAPGHGLERPVTTDHVNVRPLGPDQLLAQVLELDRYAGPDGRVDPALEREYLSRTSDLLGRTDLEIMAVRVGHRVIPADGLTVAGPVGGDPRSGLWTVVTHSGITLAPYIAETVADEICHGNLNSVLDGFRPTRFAAKNHVSSGYDSPRAPGEQ